MDQKNGSRFIVLKIISYFRRRCRYNKYVAAFYNYIVKNVYFKINGVDRMMKKQDYVFSEDKLKTKFYLPCYKKDLIQYSILMNKNYFEYDLLWKLTFTWKDGLLGKKLKDRVMLDIGANIGNHTLFFLKECGASFSYCFEPIKEIFDILSKNILINELSGKTSLYNLAVGETEGKADVVSFHSDNLGGACLKKKDDGQIRVVSVDSLDIRDDVAFVKIDVEGFELNVVLGMCDFLKKNHPIIFIEIRDCFFDRINSILIAMGYECELVEEMYGMNCSNYIYY